jgi:hypothetical protein
MANTNQQNIALTDLPPEMIIEIAKHMKPIDLGKLYRTCKYMNKLLIKMQPDAKEKYLRVLFNRLVSALAPYSVFSFDYFSTNNNRNYANDISFKYIFENKLINSKQLTLKRYCKCLKREANFA